MPISFKSPLSSSVANDTFLDKTIDDIKTGKLTLRKFDGDTNAIDDAQVFINEIADIQGTVGEGDPNAKTYSSEQIIANGDDRKAAIGKLDAQVKINLDDIENLEDLIVGGAIQLRSYISDSAYETANGAPTGGEVYYNSTTGKGRIYDAVEAQWTDIGSGVLGVQEVPTGTVDGVNTAFNISNAPLNDEALNVFVNGLIIPKSEYSFSSPTITFSSPPAAGQDVYVSYLSEGNPASPVVSVGTNNVVYHSVTAGEETAKQFELPTDPATDAHLLVDVIGGTTQQYSVDFTISGTTFDWNGLGLDGVLVEGDVVRIQYFN